MVVVWVELFIFTTIVVFNLLIIHQQLLLLSSIFSFFIKITLKMRFYFKNLHSIHWQYFVFPPLTLLIATKFKVTIFILIAIIIIFNHFIILNFFNFYQYLFIILISYYYYFLQQFNLFFKAFGLVFCYILQNYFYKKNI